MQRKNLRLWLQPFGPQPNSYGTGTIQLKFGREKMQWLVYYDNIQPNDVKLPAEARAETGPVRFRVFYDNPGQRIVLFRNGRRLGEWSLKPKNRAAWDGTAGSPASRPLFRLRESWRKCGVAIPAAERVALGWRGARRR